MAAFKWKNSAKTCCRCHRGHGSRTHCSKLLFWLRTHLYTDSIQTRTGTMLRIRLKTAAKNCLHGRVSVLKCKRARFWADISKKKERLYAWKRRVGSSKRSKRARHIKSSSVERLYMEARLVFHVKLNNAANILWWVFGFIRAGSSMSEPQESICRASTADEKQFVGAKLWFDRWRGSKMFYYSNRTVWAALGGRAGSIWWQPSLDEDENTRFCWCSPTQFCPETKEGGTPPSPQSKQLFLHINQGKRDNWRVMFSMIAQRSWSNRSV